MAEKSISEQIIDGFLEKVEGADIIDAERLAKLRIVLASDKPKKTDILAAIKEEAAE